MKFSKENYLNILKHNPNAREENGETILIWACENLLPIADIEEILEYPINVNAQDKIKVTALTAALVSACEDKEYCNKLIELLIEYGANVNHQDINLNAPMHFAVSTKNIEAIKLLISHNANLNLSNKFKVTPLRIALNDKNPIISEILVQNGADVDITDIHGNNAIHIAIRNHKLELAFEIIHLSKDINKHNHFLENPSFMAFKEGFKELEKAIEYLANQKSTWLDHGNNHLMEACLNGEFRLAKFFIKNGQKVNHLNNHNNTPLICAAFAGHIDIVELLIEHGAKIDHQGEKQYSALHWAARKGHEHIVNMLLEKGANPNQQDHRGQTPLYLTIEFEKHACFEILVNKSDVNLSNNKGNTPLIKSIIFDEWEMMAHLLQNNADTKICDNFGRLPIDIAQDKKAFSAQILIKEASQKQQESLYLPSVFR